MDAPARKSFPSRDVLCILRCFWAPSCYFDALWRQLHLSGAWTPSHFFHLLRLGGPSDNHPLSKRDDLSPCSLFCSQGHDARRLHLPHPNGPNGFSLPRWRNPSLGLFWCQREWGPRFLPSPLQSTVGSLVLTISHWKWALRHSCAHTAQHAVHDRSPSMYVSPHIFGQSISCPVAMSSPISRLHTEHVRSLGFGLPADLFSCLATHEPAPVGEACVACRSGQILARTLVKLRGNRKSIAMTSSTTRDDGTLPGVWVWNITKISSKAANKGLRKAPAKINRPTNPEVSLPLCHPQHIHAEGNIHSHLIRMEHKHPIFWSELTSLQRTLEGPG